MFTLRFASFKLFYCVRPRSQSLIRTRPREAVEATSASRLGGRQRRRVRDLHFTTIMDDILDNLDNFIEVIQPLHPALSLVHSIWSKCRKVSIYKKQCNSIAERAQAILETVNGQLSSARHLNDNARSNIKALEAGLHKVLDQLHQFVGWNTLTCLLRLREIERGLRKAEQTLTDLSSRFNIAALIQVQNRQEQARKQDAQILEKLVGIAARHDELLKALQIRKADEIPAQFVIQRELSKLPRDAPQRKVLAATLGALQRSTGRQSLETQAWHISPYDLDIDDDERLGAGSFGTVKKARHFGTVVAVKLFESGTSHQKVLEEVTIWARLTHEHVLQMFGACDTSDPPFIVSKYMENGNALEHLARYPSADRTRMVHEIALGMTYLHAQNVIHGDLKPSNILINDSQKACIADFGLSKIKQDLRSRATISPSKVMGTLRFMAPEQMQGRMVAASDVYSYGMLLYQIFTGDVPFIEVPDVTIYHTIVVMKQRLERLDNHDSPEVGLTSRMWDLIMECSVPVSSERPTFQQVQQSTATQLGGPRPSESRSPKVVRLKSSAGGGEERTLVAPYANVKDPPLLLGSPRQSESMTPTSPPRQTVLPPGEVPAAPNDVPPPASTRSQPSHSSDEDHTVIVRAADSDKLSKARRLECLGDDLRLKGEYASATRALTEAKTAYADVGERLGVADCLLSLGHIMRMPSQYAQATASADEARTIYKALGNGRGEADCMRLRGEIMRDQGKYREATATLKEAKDTYESLGSRQGVASCMRSLGGISLSQNRLGDASATLEAAKGIFKDLDHRRGVANCTSTLGVVVRKQKQYSESAALLEEAETLYKDLGDRAGVAGCRRNQGYLMRELNNLEGAVVAWKEAKQMYEDLGMPLEVRDCEAAINRAEAKINRADRGL